MADLDLEKLYSPSKWVIRMPTDVVVGKHAEILKEYGKNILNEVPNQLNIPYGEREKEKIDIFGTDLPNEAPILVFIHGGYWQEVGLVRSTYHAIAKNLHKNKIKTFFVGYELAPQVTVPQIVKAVEIATLKCINYAKEHDSKGLYIAGYSVGAQLVAMLTTKFIETLPEQDREQIKSLVLLAGIYDLLELPKTSVNIPLKMDYDTALAMSPLKQTLNAGEKIQVHVVFAENDSPIFKQQARLLYKKFIESGIHATELFVENVDHFDLVEKLAENEGYKLLRFFVNLINES